MAVEGRGCACSVRRLMKCVVVDMTWSMNVECHACGSAGYGSVEVGVGVMRSV